MDRVAAFAVVLFLIQTIERTSFYFSAGCAAYLLLAALAFNAGGGLPRAAGAYVFFNSFLVVILGLCYKAFLGEPADSNLQAPTTTILAYVSSMVALLVAVTISRRLSLKRGLLQEMLTESNMYRSSIGCMIFGLGGAYFISIFDSGNAPLNRIFTQLNQLIPLGIIIGVLYEIRRSGGTRSFNPAVIAGMIYYFIFYGLFSFSKQGMLTPFYCWALPVCAMRFRLTVMQVITCMLGIFIVFHYLVPYSQYGRRFLSEGQSVSARYNIATRLISHPEQTRKQFQEVQEENAGFAHYFDKAQGFWDRLNFIAVDDSLISVTEQRGTFGPSPIASTFINAVPHFILPNKPTRNFGNIYAHEVGGLPEDDITTGVSFSPASEAYHIDTWVGIFVFAPLIWILLFFILDALLGDLRTTPWGLLALTYISHTAPEGGLTGCISLFTFGAEVFIFSALFATYAGPSLGALILGRDRRSMKGKLSFQTPLAVGASEAAGDS